MKEYYSLTENNKINDYLRRRSAQLLQNKDEGESHPVVNVDFSQYVSKSEFDKHKKENDQEFKK